MVTIRDEHLEKQIDDERERRGDATMAKTLCDIARERLTELQITRRDSAERPVAATSAA